MLSLSPRSFVHSGELSGSGPGTSGDRQEAALMGSVVRVSGCSSQGRPWVMMALGGSGFLQQHI